MPEIKPTKKIIGLQATSLALFAQQKNWVELVFKEIRRKIPFQMNGICGKCLFKYQCLGFCRAAVLFNDQSLVEPYEICDEVFQKGIFPKSRILNEKESSLILNNMI